MGHRFEGRKTGAKYPNTVYAIGKLSIMGRDTCQRWIITFTKLKWQSMVTSTGIYSTYRARSERVLCIYWYNCNHWISIINNYEGAALFILLKNTKKKICNKRIDSADMNWNIFWYRIYRELIRSFCSNIDQISSGAVRSASYCISWTETQQHDLTPFRAQLSRIGAWNYLKRILEENGWRTDDQYSMNF